MVLEPRPLEVLHEQAFLDDFAADRQAEDALATMLEPEAEKPGAVADVKPGGRDIDGVHRRQRQAVAQTRRKEHRRPRRLRDARRWLEVGHAHVGPAQELLWYGADDDQDDDDEPDDPGSIR